LASKHVRIPAQKLTANYVTPDEQVIDMGAYRVVCVQRRALKTQSSTATVVIEHNSTKDVDGWLPSPTVFKLDGTDPDFQELGSFTRYIRIKVPSQADGTAVFQFDLIGKE
jgi:hypothetical protein